MQVAHATKTNKLLDSLMEAIASNSVLSEFEQAYYKKEAEKLPDASDTHLVLMLLYTSMRKQKLTVMHAQEALKLTANEDYAVIGNAIWAMNYVGAAKSVYDLISQLKLDHQPTLLIRNILTASHFYNDYELTQKAVSLMIESDDEVEAKEVEIAIRHLEIKYSNLEYAKAHFEITEEQLLHVSMIASEVIEAMDIAIPVDSKTYLLPETQYLSVVYEVKCEADKIFDLNWELSLKLAELDFDTSKIMPRFDVCENKAELVQAGVN